MKAGERKEFPVRFTSRGLVDSWDATDKFPGAALALTNLIFDQSNPEIMVSRPGVGSGLTSFPGFLSPSVVSVHTTIGNITYGMIGTILNANKDEPFAYDNVNNVFLPITGVSNANTPTTQASTGAWEPPTMAGVGVFIIVTHPGYAGSANKFGWFDITNPAAPVWSAGDTTTNALATRPMSVANFNNRAYFGLSGTSSNSLAYTDVLTLARTSSSQALTIGDQASITALCGLPIQTTSSGVVQALIVFKPFQTWQITGDSASTSNPLAQNYLSLTVGCSSARSIAQSPLGTYFASFDGPMIIDQLGVIRAVTHSSKELEPDIHAAWENATTPSRIAGGYTGTIYRVSMETVLNGATSTNDYWFDEHKRRWNGPHTFSYDCLSQLGNYFIMSSNANPGKLFKSEINPSATSTYSDNGIQVVSILLSSTFPKTQDMEMNQVVESTLELASNGSAASYQITAQDDLGNTLNSCQISILPSGGLWNSVVWGGFNWASAVNRPTTYTVPWTSVLVFNKMAIYITASAQTSLSLGTFFARYKKAGYTLNR